jgi:curved DNA-binding protein CbpA
MFGLSDGAPNMSRLISTDHYQRLGVARGATPLQLRQAYRRKAFDAHPDRRTDTADAEMAAINEAWRVLGDRGLRAAYDQTLNGSTAKPRPSSPTPPPASNAPRAEQSPDVEESDLPLTDSARWTRRWALSMGFLTLLATAFGALLIWIALGGGT